ncbi:MAG: TldD/PmbA family protein, partial [Nitrospirota bacterium]
MNRISDEQALKIIRKALSRGGEYADIFLEQRHHVSIQLEDDKIEKIITGVDDGIGIRVVFGGRSAYAYSNDFSESSLLALADTVSKAAREQKDVIINLKRIMPKVNFKIKLNPMDVDIRRKISLLENANKTARGVSQKIKQVSVTYRDSIQNVYIATSEGTISEDERIYTLAVISVVASNGEILQTGYEPIGGFIGFELFEEYSFEEVSLNTANMAVAMLSAGQAPGGRMPVVISANAGGTMIHEAVGHGLEADLAQDGLSVYSGKTGQQIASPLITVIDDST